MPPGIEPQLALHVLGATGLTAYFGLLDVAKPVPGDTVVVSGAAGAVGSIAGQIARIMGCRTVGIAGGAEKMEDLRELYRYDEAVDYKADGFMRRVEVRVLRTASTCTSTTSAARSRRAVHRRLNVGARIAICGQVSQYNAERPEPTFHPGLADRLPRDGCRASSSRTTRRASTRRSRGSRAGSMNGDIRYRETVTDGLENAPRAFIGMLNGENRGKALVRVA